jgi:hypothetical protein
MNPLENTAMVNSSAIILNLCYWNHGSKKPIAAINFLTGHKYLYYQHRPKWIQVTFQLIECH